MEYASTMGFDCTLSNDDVVKAKLPNHDLLIQASESMDVDFDGEGGDAE